MLEDAHELRRQGIDVVIGFIEPHGRADTRGAASRSRAGAAASDRVSRRDPPRDGRRGREGAASAGRARRRAGAHQRARFGPPEAVRGRARLLAAGIDVISAVNIQHIESLNDVIASTTGVRVRETIPDWVLKRADEVVNVDVSIDTLRDRLRQGKIYDAAEDRAGAQQFLPQGQPDGAARAGAAAAGDRSGGQGAGLPRAARGSSGRSFRRK